MMDAKFLALGAVSAAVGGGVFLMGSPERGEYYEMAPADVATLLATAGPGPFSREFSSDGALSFTSRKRGNDEVVWTITVAGEPFANFSAELEPEGAGTVVTVDFDFSDGELGDAAREDLEDGEEFVEGLLRLGMLEHVDATLERRAFDKNRLDQELAAYVIKNPTAVAKFEKRRSELKQSGKTLAIERALQQRMIDHPEWGGSGPRAGYAPMDYPMGESPDAGIEDVRGADPDAGIDYGEGEDPAPSGW